MREGERKDAITSLEKNQRHDLLPPTTDLLPLLLAVLESPARSEALSPARSAEKKTYLESGLQGEETEEKEDMKNQTDKGASNAKCEERDESEREEQEEKKKKTPSTRGCLAAFLLSSSFVFLRRPRPLALYLSPSLPLSPYPSRPLFFYCV